MWFKVLILLLTAETLLAKPLTPAERLALEEWSSSSPSFAKLMTPPCGRQKPHVRRLHGYLTQVFQEASRGRMDGKHWLINIYSSPHANAWIRKHSKTSGSEAEWLRKHGVPWPVRSLLDIQDQEPIIEIGITTACWSKLDFKDELAVLFKHEQAHYEEGHTSGQDRLYIWWSSQTHEAVADHLALESQLGQYDLEALPVLIEKLYVHSRARSLGWVVLSAALNTHHHIGERLALSQFYTQFLRHTNPEAQSRPFTPLPTFGRLKNKQRAGYSNPACQGWEKRFEGTVLKDLLQGDVTDDFLKMDSSAPEIFDEEYPTLLQQVEAIRRTWRLIEASDASKINKVNTFLLVTIYFTSFFENDWDAIWNQLAGPERKSLLLQQVTRMLAQNSVGEGRWTYAAFKPYAQKLRQLYSQLWPEYLMMSNPNPQSVFHHLALTLPEWQQFVSDGANLENLREEGVLRTDLLATKLNVLVSTDDGGSLYRPYVEKVLENLARLRPVDLLRHESRPGYSSYADVHSSFRAEFHLNPEIHPHCVYFIEAVRRILAPTDQILENSILETVKRVFNQPGHHAEKNSLLSMLKGNLAHLAPLEAFWPEFMHYVEDQFNEDPEDLLSVLFTLTLENLATISRHLAGSTLRPEQKLALLKFLTSVNVPFFESDMKEQQEVKKNFKAYFESLSPADFLSAVLEQPPGASGLYNKILLSLPDLSSRRAKRQWRERPDAEKQTDKIIELANHLFSATEEVLYFVQLSGGGERFVREGRLRDVERVLNFFSQIRASAFTVSSAYYDYPRSVGHFSVETGELLLNVFIEHMDEARDLTEWYRILSRLKRFIGRGFFLQSAQQQKIEAYVQRQFANLSSSQRYTWLKKDFLQTLLTSQFLGQELADYVRLSAPRSRWAKQAKRVLKQTQIKQKFTDAYFVFRNHLVESERLQPKEILSVFPEDTRTLTERTNGLHAAVRGVSALAAALQGRSGEEQMEGFEYLMGRRKDLPKFILDEGKKHLDHTKLTRLIEIFERARAELTLRTPLERSFVISSVLSGPQSLIATAEGTDYILSRILENVSAENRDFARVIAESLMQVEGRNKPLILAYVLAQKPSGAKLSDGDVICAFLDFYGAFGTKLAQYLGFTRAFEAYQERIERYQDQAMVPPLFDALMLVAKNLPDWPEERYQIIGIEGSGAANVALRYFNRDTQEEEILTILRDHIETKTAEDFRRGQLLLDALTSRPEYRDRFDFVVGLLNIVRASVELEFDKSHSFAMQIQFHKAYRHQVNGWQVQSVEPLELLNRAIRLKKAKGIVARKMANLDPQTYRSAMRAFVLAEFDILRGVHGRSSFVRLHANPDIHDGQLYIDAESQTVTLIDPGQALMITADERELALDLLQIASGFETSAGAGRLLRRRFPHLRSAGLSEVLAKPSRMSRFVHLISWLSRNSVNLPLGSVHWVLGMHRLIVLGDKAGEPIEPKIAALFAIRKTGMGLQTYNRLHLPVPTCSDLLGQSE